MSLQAVPKIEEVLYRYKPLQVETYGPLVPELEQLGRLGYKHINTLKSTHLQKPGTEPFLVPLSLMLSVSFHFTLI